MTGIILYQIQMILRKNYEMIEGLVALLIVMIIVALVIGMMAWLVQQAPFIADPWKQWIVWLLYVVGVLIILARALPLVGVRI